MALRSFCKAVPNATKVQSTQLLMIHREKIGRRLHCSRSGIFIKRNENPDSV